MRLPQGTRTHITKRIRASIYNSMDDKIVKVETETVEEFLKRGGEIKRCDSKEPQNEHLTFNGQSKFANAVSRRGGK